MYSINNEKLFQIYLFLYLNIKLQVKIQILGLHQSVENFKNLKTCAIQVYRYKDDIG